MLSEQHILDTIHAQLDDMFPAERRVAEYILDHPENAAQISITELADLSGTSDATVIRMCKRLGYKGFYQMKICLSSELGYIHLMGQQQKPSAFMSDSEVLRLLARNIIAMEDNLHPDILSSVVELLSKSQHVYVIAAGNSIPCAMDFAFRLCRVGIRTTCNTVVENTLNEISLGHKQETLVVFSHSGSSKQVLRAMELAKSREMSTVILTHSSRNSAALMADYCILTYPVTPLFHHYGVASHLFENVISDLLLYRIICNANREDAPDQVEMLLSEFKL
ncbi:MAG: MurR/RpiR family transcriptional regulator [Lachnospiraceae bacterium]|nr:MurR/RpiR family transcriptional regulator [Lachnospiraceae bacterium]